MENRYTHQFAFVLSHQRAPNKGHDARTLWTKKQFSNVRGLVRFHYIQAAHMTNFEHVPIPDAVDGKFSKFSGLMDLLRYNWKIKKKSWKSMPYALIYLHLLRYNWLLRMRAWFLMTRYLRLRYKKSGEKEKSTCLVFVDAELEAQVCRAHRFFEAHPRTKILKS